MRKYVWGRSQSAESRCGLKRVFVSLATILFASQLLLAAEPQWWTDQKRTCGLSPTLAYEAWRQQGFPCKAQSSSATTSSVTDVPVATGDMTQTMVSLAANAAIMKIKNPTTSVFMQHATNSFLTSFFNSQAEAQRQRQILEQQLEARRQEQERLRRIAEQQRIDAMFARLKSELKLEGLPFTLAMKGMNTNETLVLKGMNSSDPGDLKLKIDDNSASGYGIQGLPGIYVGGPRAPDPQVANDSPDLKLKMKMDDVTTTGSGIQGLPGIYVGGPVATEPQASNANLVSDPGSGTTGPGIPGLPGIYLDGVQPSQAPQLAAAAEKLSGQERDAAQDVALQVAQRNPEFAGTSQDVKVQNFQQTVQDYSQAAATARAAQQNLADAQARLEADHSVLDYGGSKMNSMTATPAQQQAFNQMVLLAKSDEEAAGAAEKIFNDANARLAVSRTKAAEALTALAARTPTTTDSSVVDLSHAKRDVPLSLKLDTNGTSANSGTAGITAARPARTGTVDVPVPRPEGWIAPANKGERTLAFVSSRTVALQRAGCSAEQLQELEKLRLLGQQLVRTEKLINDIDRQAPERFAEFARLDEQLSHDKQQFIDRSINALTASTYAMHSQLQQGTLKNTAEGIEVLKSWQGAISEWNDRLENLKRIRSMKRSENVQGLLELSTDMADKIKDLEELPGSHYFADLFRIVDTAKKVKDITDLSLGFAKLELISDYRVSTDSEQAEADLKARNVLLPLQRRLSDKIDVAQRNPALANISCP